MGAVGAHFFGETSRGPAHVPVSFRSPSMANESLLFACPKRSNQEKGHPRCRGRRASCPATARARCGGSLTAHPCADSELAGILPATLTGFFLRALAAAQGAPGRAERGSPCRRRKSVVSNPIALTPALSRKRERGDCYPFSRLRETKRQDCRFARRSRPKGERHGWRECTCRRRMRGRS